MAYDVPGRDYIRDHPTREGLAPAGRVVTLAWTTMLEKTTDPVCGMRIETGEAAGHSRYEGRTYHFCSEQCQARFEADPERYAAGAGALDARP